MTRFFKIELEPGAVTALAARSYYRHREKPDHQVILFGMSHIAEADFYHRTRFKLEELDITLFEGIGPDQRVIHAMRRNGLLASVATRSRRAHPIVDQEKFRREFAEQAGLVLQTDYLNDHEFSPSIVADVEANKHVALYEKVCGSIASNQITDSLEFRESMRASVDVLYSALRATGVELSKNKERASLLVGLLSRIEASHDEYDKYVIRGRNRIAMHHFDAVVRAEQHKRIGLVYGLKHCSDLHARLLRRGWHMTTQFWRPIWVMS